MSNSQSVPRLGKKLPELPKAPSASSPAIRASMQGNRSAGTKPEAALAHLLRRAGVSGWQAHVVNLPGSPDFAFHEALLALFVHGCFWHRCPYCSPHFPERNTAYWVAKFARNKARDMRARSCLRADGWRVLTVWECQLRKAPARVISRIRKALVQVHG